jgi:hypothetical protein
MIALRLVVILALVAATPSYAQKYEPHVGQAGKDVIWVPTPDEVVDRMLTMAQVGPGDIHFDLGAGNGKIAIAAAKRGATATGIEYNPDMANYANEQAKAAGVYGTGPGKAIIRQADIFVTDFTKATVITLYLLPTLNMKLRPQILSMKPGTRVVSHSFTMEDWEADEISTLDGRNAYFWLVPAQVGGNWSMDIAAATAAVPATQAVQETPAPAAPARRADRTYEVKKGDTLGEIARRFPTAGTPAAETAARIHSANPSAFIRNDMNRVRTGAILTIPGEVAPQGSEPQAAPPRKPVMQAEPAAGAQRVEVSFEQVFQKIKGWVNLSKTVQGGLREARLRGAEIAFSFIDAGGTRRDFTGKVDGRRMEGTFRDNKGREGRWSAAKR